MSAGAIPTIGIPFTSRTTTFTRAFPGKLDPPSLFGQIRKFRAAIAPSVGVATVPDCGT
jgi:hypothetical protein